MKWESPFSDKSTQAITETHKYLIIDDTPRAKTVELAIYRFDPSVPLGRTKVRSSWHASQNDAKIAAERHAKTH